jgi:hypothetical protein
MPLSSCLPTLPVLHLAASFPSAGDDYLYREADVTIPCERGEKDMRLTLPAAWACAVLAASLGTASAAMISTTPAPAKTAAMTVADTEMTVQNSYGYANLRQKPSTSSKLLQKLQQGTKVTVIEKVSGGAWSHVKVGDKEGYIQTKLLK